MIITVTLNPAVDKILRISNFQTGTMNRAVVLKKYAGGKGINVSRALKSLSKDSLSLTILGGGAGKQIRDMASEEGLSLRYVKIAENSRTCMSIISETSETVINETGPAVTASEVADFKSLFTETVSAGDMIVISGSAAIGFGEDIFCDLILMARQQQATVILDTSGEPLKKALTASPHVIKINRDELMAISGKSPPSDDRILKELGKINKKGVFISIATDGDRAIHAASEGKLYTVMPPEVKAVNALGCGDSFTAGLALSLSEGKTTEEALISGACAGSASSMELGAGFLDKDKVDEFIGHITNPSEKKPGT
ncbi:1-phosphofructokinase family hexose kinase [Candidatus Magnetomonas plexicatena]|uniref:1-phosphofructokinase family hexose kinase n=1 Tax=Candidatus Magnetomonas plexicatena TaxID=2552947 RepID=UPI001C783FE1|nr:1-phosphofructokinase family hexose kinase [Nitrospirales bacterium LBB_01]